VNSWLCWNVSAAGRRSVNHQGTSPWCAAAGRPEPMRPGCIIIVHLDRAISAFKGATQGYVPPVVGCIGFKKKSGGMHARDRTKRGSCTYVRPRRGIACFAPAPPPVDRPRGRSSGGDRETRASPWHKKPRGSRHAAVVRPRSGPFGAPDTSDPWRVSGAPKPCQLVGVIVSHHVRIQWRSCRWFSFGPRPNINPQKFWPIDVNFLYSRFGFGSPVRSCGFPVPLFTFACILVWVWVTHLYLANLSGQHAWCLAALLYPSVFISLLKKKIKMNFDLFLFHRLCLLLLLHVLQQIEMELFAAVPTRSKLTITWLQD